MRRRRTRQRPPREKRRFLLTIDERGQLHRRQLRGVLCGAQGCRQLGNPCWLPDDGDEPSEYYCYGHMRNQGYCPGCGNFWAGVESFDFSRTGYCENCAAEFEEPDYDDWDEFGEREPDPWEAALADCYSQDWGATCGAAGSEFCDWDCPIRRDYYRRERARDT